MEHQDKNGHDSLMTPAEVAALFRVDPKTVTRWAVAGKLHSLRTLGGHRRYRSTEVQALLAQATSDESAAAAVGVAPRVDHVPGPAAGVADAAR